jgi:hypothetical protein
MKVCRDCGERKEDKDFNVDGEGYQYQPCKTCCGKRNKEWRNKHVEHLKSYMKEWIDNNRDKHNSYNRNRNKKLKDSVLAYYGNKCICCGETEPKFLTIDHVLNDGAAHRKEVHGDKIYSHIIKANFPDTFQILCWNCNLGKHINGGVCPHKSQ